jgi:5'-deoxynucleotidase YfbR-like HD superfamily hydrolase
MILVHDIIEIEAIDYNPISTHGGGGGHAFDHSAFEEKYLREMKAARNIFEKLPSELAEDFMSLFEEYINTKAKKELATREGCFAYALDKIEAVVQVTDWKKWKNKSDNNYFKKSMDYMHTWSDYEPALKEFADLVEGEARKLIE